MTCLYICVCVLVVSAKVYNKAIEAMPESQLLNFALADLLELNHKKEVRRPSKQDGTKGNGASRQWRDTEKERKNEWMSESKNSGRRKREGKGEGSGRIVIKTSSVESENE